MTIAAIALVRLPASKIPEKSLFRALEDGALVKVGASFDEDPEELFDSLVDVLGDVIDEHDDERGVLMIPDVARPSAKTYDAIVEEIGEGGTWAREPETALGGGAAGLGDMLGQMMQAVGPGTLAEIQRAMSAADPAALEEAKRAVESATSGGGSASIEALLGGGKLPFDLGSPQMQEAIAKMAQTLQNDPAMLERLSSQLFGAGGQDDEDEEEGSEEDPRKR
jgi:hypothetical protein